MKTNKIRSLIWAVIGACGFALAAQAAAPLVNTPIGNQAKASYTDDSGVSREVFSNTVVTLVTQVHGLTLEHPNAKFATPGQWVYFTHSVTNDGNGPDAFDLAAAQTLAPFTFESIVIYADANQDGLPDNFTPITATTELAPGAEFHFVVAAKIPASATLTQLASVTVTAESSAFVDIGTTPDLQKTNVDTITITNDAVFTVNKSINIPSGVPGTTVTYTINYTNNGSAAATDFTLTDEIPADMVYVANSARWNTYALSDDDDGSEATAPAVSYDFGETAAGFTTLVVANVAPGASGSFTFQTTVAAGTPPGIINNQAEFDYSSNGNDYDGESNIVPFTVIQVPGVTLTPPALPIPAVPAGGTATWINVLTNDGTGIDSFDITITPGHNFPAGTTFQLFQADGQTPMVDTNGNGVPDTGPLAPGATYNVVLKANIPIGAPNGDNGGLGYTVNKVATSFFGPLHPDGSDDADDLLDEITGASVDLTANATLPGGAGAGAGPEVAAVVTQTANPGATTVFNLFVNNTGPSTDSFNLVADQNTVFGAVNDLPAGWTVVFRSGSANGPVITNTGPIPSGGNAPVFAVVSVPPGTPPGAVSIFFQALSPTSGALDPLHAAVDVNVVRELSIQTDNIGQTFPGGSVVYEHILTNNGNVTEGGADSDVTFALANVGANSAQWTSTVHFDANNNGIIDPAELPINFAVQNLNVVRPGGLLRGESIRLLVKVVAPLGATDGATMATTITIATSNVAAGEYDAGGDFVSAAPASVANTDTTNVVRGDLTILKEQAISLNNNGVLDTAFTTAQVSAPPGAAIVYRLTVTNIGAAAATGITVNDTVPAHTTYNTAFESARFTALAGETDPGSLPVVAAPVGGALVFNVGTLDPTETAVMSFRVLINE